MIRKAAFSDTQRILDLLLEMQRLSKYAPDVDVDQITARSLVATAIQRNEGKHQGGTIVLVEEKDGQIEAFIIGILDRVYHIGNRLQANDLFLFATPKASRTAATRLIDGYIEWALANPKVAKIMLSWTDALGVDSDKIERLYAKKGFHRVGGIWERDGS